MASSSALLFSQHSGRVGEARVTGRAVVKLQPGKFIAASPDVFLEDTYAHLDVGPRVEHRRSFRRLEFLGMESGNDLHQAHCTAIALRNRVESRFDRHDRNDQQRVDAVARAFAIRGAHELPGCLFGDVILPGDDTCKRVDARVGQRGEMAGLGHGRLPLGGHRRQRGRDLRRARAQGGNGP